VSFVREDVWTDKKHELAKAVRELLDRFGIPTTQKIAGIYTIDLVREFEQRLQGVPDSKIDEAIDFMVGRLARIKGA
jgi:hypothetical protein